MRWFPVWRRCSLYQCGGVLFLSLSARVERSELYRRWDTLSLLFKIKWALVLFRYVFPNSSAETKNHLNTLIIHNYGRWVDTIFMAYKHCTIQLINTFLSIDIDECTDDQALCSNGGSCVNLEGSYRCDCINGWTGKSCDEGILFMSINGVFRLCFFFY